MDSFAPDHIFTAEDVKSTFFKTVLARGEAEIHGQVYKWIAFRGMTPDWAVYYGGRSEWDQNIWIKGRKLNDMEKVKELIKGEDEFYGLYRQ